MKVNLHPMFTGLSGKLGNIVYVTLAKQMVDGQVIKDAGTYARQLGIKTAPNSIQQDNIILAFTIVVNKFNSLKLDTANYQTWQDQADYYEQTLGRYTTAYQLFMSFYMTKYNTTLGAYVQPTDLSNGTSLSWADRDTRLWS